MKALEIMGNLAGFACAGLLLAIVAWCYAGDGTLLITANTFGEIWLDFAIFIPATLLTLFVVVRKFRGDHDN